MPAEPECAWGKTDRQGAWHDLAAHCLDVAAVFEVLLAIDTLRRRINTAAGRPIGETDVARLSALVFLHDVGKLHPGFQAKGWPDPGGWAGRFVPHAGAGRGLVAQVCIDEAHPLRRTFEQIFDWSSGIEDLLAAVFAHHGRPVPVVCGADGDWPDGVERYSWRKAARHLDEWLQRAFPGAFIDAPPLPCSPAFVHEFAGLTALADWIGSNRDFFEFVPDLPAEYATRARDAAKRAVAAIGLDPSVWPPAQTKFEAVTGFTPNSAQSEIAALDPAEPLVILEAETGSGKTEAALVYFARVFAAGEVSGLYFAVPTRAAATQLHGRVDRALRRMFGEGAPEAVLAIPGQMRAGVGRGQMLPDFSVLWEDRVGPQPARWAAEHATRFLAATIAVGTVDQAMLAALQIKHAPLRAAALSRSLLVIDEVHASDAYMTRILSALLDAHLAIGGKAMLMSATLGSVARARYLKAPQPNRGVAAATAFPAVWTHHGAVAPKNAGPEKSVLVEARMSWEAEAVAAAAISAARRGARVLVIRNTVKEAARTFRNVRSAGAGDLLLQVAGGPALHHSRFAPEDRALLDSAVEAALAGRGDRSPEGRIVIGTQTLEQSLDIDADHLISDLCPIDVLLQRIGRLHRHRLPRPEGFETATALICMPAGGLDRLTAPAFENGLGAWDRGGLNGIYMDLAVLDLTAGLIQSQPLWEIPRMNRLLVEGATHPENRAEHLARKGAGWQRYDDRVSGREAAERGIAEYSILRRDRNFPEAFLGSEERVMTRLGAEGVVVPLAPGTKGPFGTEISRLALPAHWHLPAPPDAPQPLRAEGPNLFLDLGRVVLRYGREGIDRASDDLPEFDS